MLTMSVFRNITSNTVNFKVLIQLQKCYSVKFVVIIHCQNGAFRCPGHGYGDDAMYPAVSPDRHQC